MDCYLYRGVDLEGDEWWLAFEKKPSMKSGNFRIFFSYHEDKNEPFKEWLVPNGSRRLKLTNSARLQTLVKAKSVNLNLISAGTVSSDDEAFAVELEWNSIAPDLRELAGERDVIDLVWYREENQLRFGLPNTPFNASLAHELGLPDDSLLNGYIGWQTEARQITFRGGFADEYWHDGSFDLQNVGVLFSDSLNSPTDELSTAIKSVSLPQRSFVEVRRTQSDERTVVVTTQPIQFYSANAFRYYWQAQITAKPTGVKELDVSVETSFGTRSRSQTIEQIVWKHRTVHSGQLRDGLCVDSYRVNVPYQVGLNGGDTGSRVLVAGGGRSVAERFDNFEIVLFKLLRTALLGD
ncbi:hypothetical protein [Fuerstiella marisgermanici]|uniref:Uncharacterized protein n=1 Tax=Fuerstiella marisgermanici TaxID=1891926 RepID=A0A1P8WMB4_9PLAN|nr:hypothetical protein [Fuerstiella marisgermanici]APZ95205.1 hypothetical protein Fuma_04861 [Fuerstiella marisgermanici]